SSAANVTVRPRRAGPLNPECRGLHCALHTRYAAPWYRASSPRLLAGARPPPLRSTGLRHQSPSTVTPPPSCAACAARWASIESPVVPTVVPSLLYLLTRHRHTP